MARPIEPTPPLTGADADFLLEEIAYVLPSAERARRVDEARAFLAMVTPAPNKLAVIHAAVQHDFPTADIDQMLAEIASGYGPASE